jgi:hypothetical protein
MRAMTRAAVFVATAVLLGSPAAFAAELPRGPVTAATVASTQAEATSAAAASTEADRVKALSGVALDDAKAKAAAAAAKAEQTHDPADIAAAADASAKQADAQKDFDAKSAAAAKAAADSTEAASNAAREAASFAKLSSGTSTESAASLPDDTSLPASDRSSNVDFLSHVTGKLSYKPGEPYNNGASCPAPNPSKCPGFSSLNFLHYENLGYDFMVANGTAGLSVWSLKDPAHPKYVAQVTVAQLQAKQPAGDDAMTQFWEGENMTVDSRRKIAFLSRDANTRGFFAVDMKDPWNPVVIGFQKVWQGHTMTCLNDCRFLWSVGGVQQPPPGSPQLPARSSAVSVTDVRDVEHPFTYSTPIAANVRRTGATGGQGTHSVDVDFDGVAWVSGGGGVRGWWTEGLHKDPATGQDRYATPYDPLPYAGGSVAGNVGSFMHNAYHVPTALGDQAAGDVMLITNESNNTQCSRAGLFIIASLAGTRDATDNVGTPQVPVTMSRLATYSTLGKPGEFIDPTRAVGDCSAHWFTVNGNIVALGNYEQGTRFVDITNPRSPQQVGYFRVPAQGTRGTPGEVVSSNTAAPYWHGKYVYVADYGRGIDVLKFHGVSGNTQPKTCWNSCADYQTMQVAEDTDGGAGGTVPATLSLALGASASFGPFTPGVAKDYTASTTANVISTAGDAALASSDPGHLMNGTFALPSPLEVSLSKSAWTAPTSNESVSIGFKQHIGAGDALRTGAYSKTLTFTLSTTTP